MDITAQALILSQTLTLSQAGFTGWLAKQVGRDDPVGDLARDVAVDRDWPRNRKDFRDYWEYFERYGASDAATRSLARAWLEFIEDWENAPYCKMPIPADLRWEVWERDNFTCKNCGTRRNLSVDHVVAETNGGLTELENLQTLCRSCNSKKGAR